MAKWSALAATDFQSGLRRIQLETGCGPVFRRNTMGVIVLKSANIAAWTATLPPGATLDRGRKHAARQLAVYMPENGRCVRLEAGYRDPGQAERGIRALLAAAAHRHSSGIMALGVGEGIFDLLWARATEGVSIETESMEVPVRADTGACADELARQLEENPNLAVPQQLREVYIGDSPLMERVRKEILLAARHEFPVLIEGETGTGKEIVARQIQAYSKLKTQQFLVVNCGGIPDDLLESELFGHLKGSFSGAFSHKDGLWLLADGGILFLDEVGDLLPRHQVKVLRALESGEFRSVGGTEDLKSHARVIAATHRNLWQMVEKGLFREDLFYRLFTMRIRTPPLRSHPEDIPKLAVHFWEKATGRGAPPLPASVLAELQRCSWPGNVRELRAFLIHLSVYADGRAVTAPLVQALFNERSGRGPGSRPG